MMPKKVGSVYKKYDYRYDDKRITTGLTGNGKYNRLVPAREVPACPGPSVVAGIMFMRSANFIKPATNVLAGR